MCGGRALLWKRNPCLIQEWAKLIHPSAFVLILFFFSAKARQQSAAFLLSSKGRVLQVLNCVLNSGERSPWFTRRLQVNTLLRKRRNRFGAEKDNCFCLKVKQVPLRRDHTGITGSISSRDVVITRWVIYLSSLEVAITIHYCRAIKMMVLFLPSFHGLPFPEHIESKTGKSLYWIALK